MNDKPIYINLKTPQLQIHHYSALTVELLSVAFLGPRTPHHYSMASSQESEVGVLDNIACGSQRTPLRQPGQGGGHVAVKRGSGQTQAHMYGKHKVWREESQGVTLVRTAARGLWCRLEGLGLGRRG